MERAVREGEEDDEVVVGRMAERDAEIGDYADDAPTPTRDGGDMEIGSLERAGAAIDRGQGAGGGMGLDREGQHRKQIMGVGLIGELDASGGDGPRSLPPLRPKAATAPMPHSSDPKLCVAAQRRSHISGAVNVR